MDATVEINAIWLCLIALFLACLVTFIIILRMIDKMKNTLHLRAEIDYVRLARKALEEEMQEELLGEEKKISELYAQKLREKFREAPVTPMLTEEEDQLIKRFYESGFTKPDQ